MDFNIVVINVSWWCFSFVILHHGNICMGIHNLLGLASLLFTFQLHIKVGDHLHFMLILFLAKYHQPKVCHNVPQSCITLKHVYYTMEALCKLLFNPTINCTRLFRYSPNLNVPFCFMVNHKLFSQLMLGLPYIT